MRISRGRLGAVVGVLAVVVVVILLTRGGGDDEGLIVERSYSPSYPARGALVDDDTLTEAAAQAWRDETRRKGEGEDFRPNTTIDVLYAGRVSGEKLVRTGPDRHRMHDVVVLSSHRLVATLVRPKGGEWEVAETKSSGGAAYPPVLELTDGLYLTAADRFADDKAEAVSLPRPVDADDAAPEGPNRPQALSADLSDPLWAPSLNGPLVVRVPGDKEGTFSGQLWMGLMPDGSPLLVRAPGGAAAEQDLWDQLLSPTDAAGTSAAVRAGVKALLDGDDGNQAFSISPGSGVKVTLLGTTTLRDTPDGNRRASAVGLGFGRDRSAEAVAVGLTGPDVHKVVRTTAVVLGQHPEPTHTSLPIAATWLTSNLGERPYLLYAADPTLDRIELQVGAKTVSTQGFVGFYAPPVGRGSSDPQPATLIGVDRSGVSYPSFPIASQ